MDSKVERPVAVITRRQIYPAPGRNYRFAWKYWYDAEAQGVNGYDTLAGIEAYLKSKGFRPVRAWGVK